MNSGHIALITVGLLIALAVFLTLNRHVLGLVEPPAQPARPPRPVRPRRQVAKRPPAEMPPKAAEAVSRPISSIPTPNNDAEMVSFRNAHKLIKSGKFTQTDVLCALFDVNPGGSKEYKRVIEKYKAVAAELDKNATANEGQTAANSQ